MDMVRNMTVKQPCPRVAGHHLHNLKGSWEQIHHVCPVALSTLQERLWVRERKWRVEIVSELIGIKGLGIHTRDMELQDSQTREQLEDSILSISSVNPPIQTDSTEETLSSYFFLKCSKVKFI